MVISHCKGQVGAGYHRGERGQGGVGEDHLLHPHRELPGEVEHEAGVAYQMYSNWGYLCQDIWFYFFKNHLFVALI